MNIEERIKKLEQIVEMLQPVKGESTLPRVMVAQGVNLVVLMTKHDKTIEEFNASGIVLDSGISGFTVGETREDLTFRLYKDYELPKHVVREDKDFPKLVATKENLIILATGYTDYREEYLTGMVVKDLGREHYDIGRTDDDWLARSFEDYNHD